MQSGADVTIFNSAGHDAVFEAEINDKGAVVDWLLGAVEELEKGIGSTDEDSSTHSIQQGTEGGLDDNGSDKNTLPKESTADGSSVEEVRKQMEGIKTGDSTSQAG